MSPLIRTASFAVLLLAFVNGLEELQHGHHDISHHPNQCKPYCNPGVIRYYPDIINCTKFWQCDNGKAVLHLCPKGLNFNPNNWVCDYPNQAGCTANPKNPCPPHTTTYLPATSTLDPVTRTYEPETTTNEPFTTSYQPETTTDVPFTTTYEPETTTYEPFTTTYEPNITTYEPFTTTYEPETTTNKPFTTTYEPQTTTYEPFTTTYEPETTTNEPFTTTYVPETTTSKPFTTTYEPETTTYEPFTTTYEPETTTYEPFTSTYEPKTSTYEPFTTTYEPETTSYEPFTTTYEPETTTYEPYSTRNPLSTTTTPHHHGCKPDCAAGVIVYYPDIKSCSKYWGCFNGMAVPQYCAPGLYFNPNNWVCEKPEVSNCTANPNANCHSVTTYAPFSTTERPHETTSSKHGDKCVPPCPFSDAMYPSPRNCHQFFKCANNFPYLMDCPAHLEFSVDTQRCETRQDAKCVDGPNVPCIARVLLY